MSILDSDVFQSRHIGPDAAEAADMLKVVGAPSLDALIDQAIPARIRLNAPLDLPNGTSRTRNRSSGPRATSRCPAS